METDPPTIVRSRLGASASRRRPRSIEIIAPSFSFLQILFFYFVFQMIALSFYLLQRGEKVHTISAGICLNSLHQQFPIRDMFFSAISFQKLGSQLFSFTRRKRGGEELSTKSYLAVIQPDFCLLFLFFLGKGDQQSLWFL